jgi:TRAP-type C4-dicarboxylate transport system permease small subunit
LNLIQTISEAVDKLARIMSILVLSGLVVIVSSEVFGRYVLNSSIYWAEAVSRYLLVWLVFVSAPVVLKRRAHVSIRGLVESLPPRLVSVVDCLIDLLVFLFCVVFVRYGWRFAQAGWKVLSPTLYIPSFWPKLGLVLGGVFMLIQATCLLIESFTLCIGKKNLGKKNELLNQNP